MLSNGGPFALLVLILGVSALLLALITFFKGGESRYMGLAVGYTLSAFLIGLVGTCMGMMQIGTAFLEEPTRASLAQLAGANGVAQIPLFIGALFAAINTTILGIAHFRSKS